MSKKLNYVIGRYWYDDSNNLCCYTLGSTVFHGTKEDADNMAKHITRRANNGETYKPYYITTDRD